MSDIEQLKTERDNYRKQMNIHRKHVQRLQIYEDVIKYFCSYPLATVHDYIHVSKQAVADYEKLESRYMEKNIV
jgi:hypothetical protein